MKSSNLHESYCKQHKDTSKLQFALCHKSFVVCQKKCVYDKTY